MNISRLIRAELWKMFFAKDICICVLGEIMAYIIYFFCNTDGNIFSLSDIYIYPYMGVVLTIRFVYIAFLVSNLFSKDIQNGIVDTYLAVGAKRKDIVLAKLIYLWCIVTVITMLTSLVYIVVSFLINGIALVPIDFIISFILSLVPLFIHSMVLLIVDIYFLNGFLTFFFNIVLIISTSMLPYSITKWSYLTYNNPIIVYLYQERTELIFMVNVFGWTSIASIVALFLLIKKKGM